MQQQIAITVDQLSDLTWIWHDAEIISLNTSWGADQGVSLVLRCVLNPYEDRSALYSLGLVGDLVELVFVDVMQSIVDIKGFYSSGEVISGWTIFTHSEYLEQERRAWGNHCQHSALRHHSFATSAGSRFEIICLDTILRQV